MSEKPILFSAPMVRAILAGTKTQTRRVCKFESLEPGYNLAFSGIEAGHYCTDVPSSGAVLYSRGRGGVWEQRTKPLHCPYGQPGDLLWVRETWAVVRSEPCLAHERDWQSLRHPVIRYSADGETRRCDRPYHGPVEKGRPSIHMAREYSRLTLRVTAVRVERLQEISDKDIAAEGVEFRDYRGHAPGYSQWLAHRFRLLWDSINAERAPWASNPWVWVVGFERASP